MRFVLPVVAMLGLTQAGVIVERAPRRTVTVTTIVDVFTTTTVPFGFVQPTRNPPPQSSSSRPAQSSPQQSPPPQSSSSRPAQSSPQQSPPPQSSSSRPAQSSPQQSPPAQSSPAQSSPQQSPPPQSSNSPPAQSSPQQSPSPASSSAAPSPSSGNPPPASDYQGQVIYHHNVHRANHSSPDIAWSQALANTALKIAQSCKYGHDTATDGGGYGQNIAAGAPLVGGIASVISNQFYNGEINAFAPYYGQATPGGNNFPTVFGQFGHMSQVVWAGSTTVGCASVDCTAQGGLQNVGSGVPPIFHVCNYGPAGNIIGAFNTNIGVSLNRPTVTA